MSFFSCLLVMIGGAIGTLGRFLVGYAARPISHGFPWGTVLGINVVGSFIIGFFGTLTLAHGRFPVSENTRLFVMVGLCGGYTTFSSFSLQTLDLIRSGAWEKALTNVVLSCALCVLAVAAGHGIASHLNGHAIEIAQLDIEEES
ncbi:MAG: fluoride efflux transporter CrcB [Acetobacteraceae bacterium]